MRNSLILTRSPPTQRSESLHPLEREQLGLYPSGLRQDLQSVPRPSGSYDPRESCIRFRVVWGGEAGQLAVCNRTRSAGCRSREEREQEAKCAPIAARGGQGRKGFDGVMGGGGGLLTWEAGLFLCSSRWLDPDAESPRTQAPTTSREDLSGCDCGALSLCL